MFLGNGHRRALFSRTTILRVKENTMIYLVHKVDQLDLIWDLTDIFNEFKAQGVVVVSETQFTQIMLNDVDIVIVFIMLYEQLSKDKLQNSNCAKYICVADESKRDGILFKNVYELCEQIKCSNVILMLHNTKNIEHLTSHGIKVITFSLGTRIRKRKDKKYDIVISCQFDAKYYPVRTRVAELLNKNKHSYSLACVKHPGFSKMHATHSVHGEKFYQLLDECKLGLVCKAGWRDRMVGKYTEFGASWCLPLGDVPSCMCEEMKSSMIVIGEDDQNFTFSELCKAIDVGLQEYESRISQYTKCLQEYYSTEKNITMLLRNIQNAT